MHIAFVVIMKEEDTTTREKTQEELRLEAEAEARAKQLTLDEFKAQIASKRSEPHFNIRQAGEGTNDKDFGKLVPLNKPIMEENSEEEIVVVVCSFDFTAILFPFFFKFSFSRKNNCISRWNYFSVVNRAPSD